MNIDTEIRHITKPGANLFLELGFDTAEATRFQAESQQRINFGMLLCPTLKNLNIGISSELTHIIPRKFSNKKL